MENKLIVTMTEQELKNLVRQSVSEGVEVALLRSKQNEQENDLLKKTDAARLLSCSTSTIETLARHGKLTKHYVGKRAVRYKRDQVLKIAQQPIYYKSKPTKNGH